MAENKVTLNYDGKEFDFPLISGTLGGDGIDISKLRSQTGLITLDKGFKNTGSTISKITYLDGEKGQLFYRGYPIEQLAEKSSFTEVMYLLLRGELPSSDQMAGFEASLKKHSHLDEGMKKIAAAFPTTGHPMAMLAALTPALSAFYSDAIDVKDVAGIDAVTELLIAKFAHLCAWTYRRKHNLPFNEADPNVGFVENFYQMVFRKPGEDFHANQTIINALDKLLILHGDHEQNCSASTVRIVGSAHTGLFASIGAGVSALWGPLHGGANQAVVEMLEMIERDGGNVDKYVNKAKDKDDNFRLMGFGHRVYKNFDPRAKIIKKAADDILNALGVNDRALEIAMKLEKVALEDEYFVQRKLYPNVDFYSGIIYRALGIPTDMFTVMFALGRLPGWIAQWKEMRLTGDPIGRPRQIYQGATARDYVELANR